jgi:hypothetical protein
MVILPIDLVIISLSIKLTDNRFIIAIIINETVMIVKPSL